MTRKILTIGKRGVLYMPKDILKEFNLNEGDYVEAYGTKDGIVLKPKALVDKDQAWFWSEKWQKGEKEAEENIRKGKVKSFDKWEDGLKYLKSLRNK
jgi:AbrB family looped-hinge helix DNA binding protein